MTLSTNEPRQGVGATDNLFLSTNTDNISREKNKQTTHLKEAVFRDGGAQRYRTFLHRLKLKSQPFRRRSGVVLTLSHGFYKGV